MTRLELSAEVIWRTPTHVKIAVFQNGGKAGELVVASEHDVEILALLNYPPKPEEKGHDCGDAI